MSWAQVLTDNKYLVALIFFAGYMQGGVGI